MRASRVCTALVEGDSYSRICRDKSLLCLAGVSADLCKTGLSEAGTRFVTQVSAP